MNSNFDSDDKLLSALQKERDQRNEIGKQLSQLKDSIKTSAIESAFKLSGGRMVTSPDGSSFLDLTTKQVDKFVRTNDRGQIEIVDRNGTKRYSVKDPSQGMSIDEYFQELKTHEIAKNWFVESAPGQAIDRGDTQAPRWQDAGLSPADRLTRMRAEQAQK